MSDDNVSKGDDNGKLLYCSFCGKSQHEVRKLIAGPSVFVCDECVDLCNDIIREEIQEKDTETTTRKLPIPEEIKNTQFEAGYRTTNENQDTGFTVLNEVAGGALVVNEDLTNFLDYKFNILFKIVI